LAGHLVRLKLALLRNGLRRSQWQQQVGLVLGALFGLPLAAGGFLLLALVPRAEPRFGLLLVEAVFLALFLGWLLFPLLSFGGDTSLDPDRLVLLPLRPRQLMSGLFLAGCVGIAPLCTLAALAGGVVGFAPLGPGLLLAAAAVLVQFALCLVGSRALLTVLSRVLRSRRAKDLGIVLVSLAGIAVSVAMQVGARMAARLERLDVETLRPLGRVIGWLPPGLAARALVDAGRGRLLAATAELLAAALAVLLLGWWWWRSLDRVLVTTEPPAKVRSRPGGSGGPRGGPPVGRAAGLFPRLARPLLPADQRGAVAAKELRYLARHPRLRVGWLTTGLLGLAGVVVVAWAGWDHPALVLTAAAVVFLVTQNSLNQFGWDGPAYWANAVSGADPRGDLAGRNLAAMLVGLATAAALAVALAAVTGGWLYVPVALCLAAGALAVALGVADVVSVRFPYPVPEVTSNLWAAQGTGQGCLVGLAQMLALTVEGVLLLPVAILVAVGVAAWRPALAIACPVALLSGLAVWRVGLGMSARWLRDHQPELLTALSPRRAA
jgi:ABC-2 type transport system permease protein